MRLVAAAVVVLAGCGNNGGNRPPESNPPAVTADAMRAAAAPDAAVAIAVAPPDAAPPVCLRGDDVLALSFAGAAATVCSEYDSKCVAVTDDGTITASPRADDPVAPDAPEVTISDDERSVTVCVAGACKTLAPKLGGGVLVRRAEPDASGRYVMLTIPDGDMGDKSRLEIWSASTGKKLATQKLPWTDDEGTSIWAAWAGSLVVVYHQPGPHKPGRGTVYSVGAKKLSKAAELAQLSGWASLDDRSVFAVSPGPTLTVIDQGGKPLPKLDAAWLLTDDQRAEMDGYGVIDLAAGGGRIAILADAELGTPAITRLGFLTVDTGAHTTVDIPRCP